ncbi:MAG: GNAT family N-acetyltransferase [Thermoplasmatota archaeon]
MGCYSIVNIQALETERLLLFPICRDDMGELLRGKKMRISGYQCHEEWPGDELLEALPVMMNDLQDDPSSLGWHAWAMVEKRSSTIIGDAGFKGSPDCHGSVKLGYSVVEPFRRKGYAKEALRILACSALETGEISGMIAEIDTNNLPSKKLLISLGWEQKEGHEGFDVWALERTDIYDQDEKKRKIIEK